LGLKLVLGLHPLGELRYNELFAENRLSLGLGMQYFVPVTH